MIKFSNVIKQGIISNNLYGFINLNTRNLHICKKIYNHGLIHSYSIINNFNKIKIFYNSDQIKKTVYDIKIVSTPGNKIYISYKNLNQIHKRNKNIFILATSKGILTSEEALVIKIGGELLGILFT